MLSGIRSWLRRRTSPWYPLSQVPAGFFRNGRPDDPNAVNDPDTALTISPVFAALRLYQVTCGSLPLITYQRDTVGGRERADTLPVYSILRNRPNPAMLMGSLVEFGIREMFFGRGLFWQVQKNGDGLLTGLFPIESNRVIRIIVDDAWQKLYQVQTADGPELFRDDEIAHVFLFSLNGITGCSLLDFAGESLGLHKQLQTTASSYYRNAARLPTYLKFPGKLDADAVKNLKDQFGAEFAGSGNAGKLPVTQNGGEFAAFPGTSADDAQLIEAMGSSVTDVARWFNVSPLLLADLSRGTYSNLAADNAAFYQRSIRPVLRKIEAELNWKIFGPASPLFCEFLVDELLAGDPLQQATIAGMGIQNGWLLRSEQRAFKNLPPVPGLDQPLTPANLMPKAEPAADA